MTKRERKLLSRKKRKKQSKTNSKLRKKLFGHLFFAPCIYCKNAFFVEELTIEHIKPLCLGGTNDPDNIALACGPCNHSRGKDAWSQKRQFNKKVHQQYSSQHGRQDGETSVQDTRTPPVHCERENL